MGNEISTTSTSVGSTSNDVYTLEFDGLRNTITVYRDGSWVCSFEAYNNVSSKSNGKWPNGTFTFAYFKAHNGDEDSSYGTYGNIIFNVAGRSGMGIHGGRKNKKDGLGRSGPKYCTMGCIRTYDDSVRKIHSYVKKSSKKVTLTVKNN